MSTPSGRTVSSREAYYDRIAPVQLAPLWTRLKSLVPKASLGVMAAA